MKTADYARNLLIFLDANLILFAGYYIYIETSSPRRANDKAVLTFKGGFYQQPMCLSFFYHMYGQNINELNVYNRGVLLWSKVKQQGNAWKKAEVPIRGLVDVSELWKNNISFCFKFVTDVNNASD